VAKDHPEVIREAPRSQSPRTPSCRGLATALLAYYAFFSISQLLLAGRGKHISAELAELFGVARSTVYRAIKRAESTGTAATKTKPRRHDHNGQGSSGAVREHSTPAGP